ncbi:hypothetical protein BST81_10635 [Leptolyngbya sp. 'hensonii']|nr:hypothetical protein BST81_10635 [Leptolyngbya sp. 'hensonii']
MLTQQAAIAVIQQCDGIYQLVVKLLYRSGLRLIAGLRLRVKDVDFVQQRTCEWVVYAFAAPKIKIETQHAASLCF